MFIYGEHVKLMASGFVIFFNSQMNPGLSHCRASSGPSRGPDLPPPPPHVQQGSRGRRRLPWPRPQTGDPGPHCRLPCREGAEARLPPPLPLSWGRVAESMAMSEGTCKSQRVCTTDNGLLHLPELQGDGGLSS